MAALSRINGCKCRIHFRVAGGAPGDPYFFAVDMTSATFNRSAENTTFKVLGDCADQSGEGTVAHSLSGEGQYANTDVGQVLLKEGQLIDWKLYLDEVGDPNDFVSGTNRIDSLDISISPDENITFSFASTGDGTYTLSNMW